MAFSSKRQYSAYRILESFVNWVRNVSKNKATKNDIFMHVNAVAGEMSPYPPYDIYSHLDQP